MDANTVRLLRWPSLIMAAFGLSLCFFLCGCTGASESRSYESLESAIADDESPFPRVELADLQALDAKETTTLAKGSGVLDTTYMYDFEPFTGKRDAAVDDAPSAEGSAAASGDGEGTAEYDLPLAASSAFFPFAAEVVERRYTQQSYDDYGVPLESVATPTALEALSEGEDLVLVSSPPNDEQQAAIDASGEDVRCVPVAREGLAFYVRDDSLAPDAQPAFSSEEILEAYRADGSSWTAFALEHGNGSTMCFEKFSQGQSSSLDVPDSVQVYPDMVSIVGGAALTDRSVGYAFNQFYRRCASSKAMKLAEVDGVGPSWDAVRTGEYPLMFDVCVLYNANSSCADAAQGLIDWLSSPEGQQAIYDVGLQPIPGDRR